MSIDDGNSTEPFSRQHPFSREQIARAADIVAKEPKFKRQIMNVTAGYREYARRQFLAIQVTSVIVAPSIYAAAYSDRPISRAALNRWLAVSIASLLYRSLAVRWHYDATPEQVARSVGLRSMMLSMFAIAILFWIWTIWSFVGQTLTATVLLVVIGLFALTIAMLGILPVSPLPTVVQIVVLWAALAVRMLQQQTLPTAPILAMVCVMAGTSWATVHVAITQVRKPLDHSDKQDLLLAELKAANAQSAALKEKLWEDVQRRSTFFSGASHDFRQRLYGLKLMITSAQLGLESAESLQVPLHRIGDEIHELDSYITEMLNFARIEAVDATPTYELVNLQDTFQRIALQFENIEVARNVELTMRATDIQLNTDASMLERMLGNIISNAMKFTRRKVLVAARRSSIDGSTLIEVWDQGPGIDPGNISRIFTAFHQEERNTHPTQSPVQRGVGLGLAVVQRFADALGYRVEVKSWPPRGSMFRIHTASSDASTHEIKEDRST